MKKTMNRAPQLATISKCSPFWFISMVLLARSYLWCKSVINNNELGSVPTLWCEQLSNVKAPQIKFRLMWTRLMKFIPYKVVISNMFGNRLPSTTIIYKLMITLNSQRSTGPVPSLLCLLMFDRKQPVESRSARLVANCDSQGTDRCEDRCRPHWP